MTAGIAWRHIYSIASWSPSQSDPLTVSYICQRQSSSLILPSAAAMPPCAETVWLRVGNTFEMQAVFKPSRSEEHTSELQSRRDLVCRLLLEKKKKKTQQKLIQARIKQTQSKRLTTLLDDR